MNAICEDLFMNVMGEMFSVHCFFYISPYSRQGGVKLPPRPNSLKYLKNNLSY